MSMINNFKHYVEELSVSLLDETELSKKRLKSLLNVLNISPEEFFQITRHNVFPYLFFNRKVELMEDIASCLQQDLAAILIDECGYIFGQLFIKETINIDLYFQDFVKLANLDSKKITMGQLFKSCLLILTKTISLSLGSEDESNILRVKITITFKY